MPYTTEIIDNGKGVLHIGSDTVSGKDLISSAASMLRQVREGLTPVYSLADLSMVKDFAVSADEIAQNADVNRRIARHLSSVKVAIVAPADDIYGMARMWQAYIDSTGWTARVFRTTEEARTWLKLIAGR